MQQKELKCTVNEKQFHGATSIDKGDHYVLRVSFINDEQDATIRTARGGVRKFKTLDAVNKMLNEVGINNWLVR
ncbi:MAG: hypothetical protein HRU18_00850 [Pseudoalteromonas sp.]|uniref:hypothetical protein n=1 Tax=Pseudoalteromonas sp. TaxID=53249 RepID=UPI001DD8F3A9|nr:hypothetical protein [Pseudoalteromonas sp.]NRA76728.1 hypothetical protein [Pseudoalteromonas sp.]